MIAITPSFEVLDMPRREKILKLLEIAARTCYKSYDRIEEGSAEQLLKMLMQAGHESVIEHEKITVRVTFSRAILDEWTRHRLASYSVESTRYCKYADQIECIRPWWWNLESEVSNIEERRQLWTTAMGNAEAYYKALLNYDVTAQDARGVLPLDLKTVMVCTANLREWRHIFKMRCAMGAHPEFKRIARPLMLKFQQALPEIFEPGMHDLSEVWTTRSAWAADLTDKGAA